MVREVKGLARCHSESKRRSWHSVLESGCTVDVDPLPSAWRKAAEARAACIFSSSGEVMTGERC